MNILIFIVRQVQEYMLMNQHKYTVGTSVEYADEIEKTIYQAISKSVYS